MYTDKKNVKKCYANELIKCNQTLSLIRAAGSSWYSPLLSDFTHVPASTSHFIPAGQQCTPSLQQTAC